MIATQDSRVKDILLDQLLRQTLQEQMAYAEPPPAVWERIRQRARACQMTARYAGGRFVAHIRDGTPEAVGELHERYRARVYQTTLIGHLCHLPWHI